MHEQTITQFIKFQLSELSNKCQSLICMGGSGRPKLICDLSAAGSKSSLSGGGCGRLTRRETSLATSQSPSTPVGSKPAHGWINRMICMAERLSYSTMPSTMAATRKRSATREGGIIRRSATRRLSCWGVDR